MTPAEQFAKNLRTLRRASGYSQKALSFLAGMDRVLVGRYESGETFPRASAIVKLAGALSATPNDLFAGIEWKRGVYESGRLLIGEDA